MRIICFILVFFFLSCGPTTNESTQEDPLNNLLGIDSGAVHGATIGDDIEYVMKQMKPHIVSEMPDEITARIPLNIKDSTFYDIDYDFKNGKLFSIDLDISPRTLEDCRLLFNDFSEYYNGIYGRSKMDEDYAVWYTKSSTGEDLEISMINESKQRGKPYLAISFYQEDGIAD